MLNVLNNILKLLLIFRQENLSMSMKLNAVERRSRELLLTQGAAMSGAAVALSGLSTRLEGLIDQLIASYNISIKDLEVSIHDSSSSRWKVNILTNVKNDYFFPCTIKSKIERLFSLYDH